MHVGGKPSENDFTSFNLHPWCQSKYGSWLEGESLAWLCIMGPDDTIKRYNDLYAAIEEVYYDKHPAAGCVKKVKMVGCARGKCKSADATEGPA